MTRVLAGTLLALALASCAERPAPIPTPAASTTAGATAKATASAPPAAPTATSSAPPGPTSMPTAAPSPTPDPPLRLAVVGDYGVDDADEGRVAELVASWSPEMVVTTGDNNYPAGEAETIDANIGKYYQQYIGAYQGGYGPGAAENHFFPVLGNHDWQTAGAAPYLEYFTLPGNERYYAVTRGAVELFALDSALDEPDGLTPGSVQGQWLRQELDGSRACWKIVVMHHPPFSSGLHGSSPWMQWPYHEWGADVVLAGHDHHYERISRDGVVYLVNGLGGQVRYELSEPVAGSELRFNESFGALLLTATPTELTLEFWAWRGELVDRHVLRKNCSS